MKIGIFGSGYVGLVSAVCLAELGNEVVCMDVAPEKVEKLNLGVATIYERGLSELLVKNLREKRLAFTTNSEAAVDHGDVLFIAVGTPMQEDGLPNMQHVESVARSIGKYIKSYKIIINKSTVPVGASGMVRSWIQQEMQAKVDFSVASNPEFLREGTAIRDFMEPDRIIIGAESKEVFEKIAAIYQPLTDNKARLFFMDQTSAEVTKYSANAFLAMKISFINEIANFCEKVGANVDHVKLGISTDQRIGDKFLNPGIGYGGSCFPKDVQALIRLGEKVDYDFQIIQAVERVNAAQKLKIIAKLKELYPSLAGKKIALWGLAFKPFTDDIREAASLEIVKTLLEEKAEVFAHDPVAVENFQKLFPAVVFKNDNYAVLDGADALCIVTEWSEYHQTDFAKIKSLMRKPFIVDGRNLFRLEQMEKLGFVYKSIGRPSLGLS